MADERAVCEGCGATYRIPDGLRGRRAKCKKCGTTVVLEAPPQPTDAEPAEPDWNALEQAAGQAAASVAAAPSEPILPDARKPAQAPAPRPAGGESMGALCRRLGNRIEGALQFAAQQTRRYPLSLASRTCGCCARARKVQVYAISWQGHFSQGMVLSPWSFLTILAGWIIIKHRYKIVTYTTFHGICTPCYYKFRLVRMVGMLLVLTGAVLLVVAFVKFVINLADLTGTHRAPEAPGNIIVSVLLMFCGIAAWWGARQFRVPWALRSVGPWPFRRKKMVVSA